MIRTFLGCFVLLTAARAEEVNQAKILQPPSYFPAQTLSEGTTAQASEGAVVENAVSSKTAAGPSNKASDEVIRNRTNQSGISVNKKHKVVAGDTLWDISNKYYGDPFKWGRIYNFNLNLIKNPDMIYPDSEIEIPDIKEIVAPEIRQPLLSPESDVVSGKEESTSPTVHDAGKAVSSVSLRPDGDEVVVLDEESRKPAVTAGTIPAEGIPSDVEETVDPTELNEEMPEGQLTFAAMAKTLKVDRKFFDGEVVEKNGEDEFEKAGFIQPGDMLMVRIYSPENYVPGDKLAVYQKGVKIGGRMTAQYVGTLKIISIDGKMASCRAMKANTAIDGDMYVRKIVPRAKKEN